MIDYGLENKVCLVTGSSRGIGLSIVDHFIQQNARVISVSRSGITHQNREKLHSYQYDLQAASAVNLFCDHFIQEMGLPDVVIHNLGGSCQVTSDFASVNEWKKVWQLNLGIPIEFNNYLIPNYLKNKKELKIIHVSSSAVKTSQGYLPYITAKAALESYVKAMALRYSQHGIYMNAVAPGAVNLPGRYFSELQKENPLQFQEFLKNIPARRLAEPQEIASVVLFLASKHANYMTGSIVSADGGMC